MFDSTHSMNDIMSHFRLMASIVIPSEPVRDIVQASNAGETAWRAYAAKNPRLSALTPNTVLYQVIRGFWLVMNTGCPVLDVNQIDLSLTFPHTLLVNTLENFNLQQLQATIDQPGAFDEFVQKLTDHLSPTVTEMWTGNESALVHQHLARLQALNPLADTFEADLQKWEQEVEQLPSPLSGYILRFGSVYIQALLSASQPPEKASDVDELNEESSPVETLDSAYSPQSDSFGLAASEMMKIYDLVRSAFTNKFTLKDARMANPQSISQTLSLVVTEVRDLVSEFGMLESNSVLVRNLNTQAKGAALQYFNNERFRKIMEMFGRMIGTIDSSTIPDPTQKNDETTLSDRLQDLSAEGLNLMAHDEDAFGMSYASDALPTADRGGSGEEEGPFCMAVDNSGSMAEGAKDVWSKALIMATAEVAFRKNRPFAVILFESNVSSKNVLLIVPPQDAHRVLEIAQVLPTGGTNFEAALKAALNVLDTDSRWRDADILFITDGHAVVGSDFLRTFRKAKEDKGIKVHSILINVGSSASRSGVAPFSDTIRSVTELSDKLASEALSLV